LQKSKKGNKNLELLTQKYWLKFIWVLRVSSGHFSFATDGRKSTALMLFLPVGSKVLLQPRGLEISSEIILKTSGFRNKFWW